MSIYCKGQGQSKYWTLDPVDFPRSRYNAASAGGLKWAEPGQAMELSAVFQEAILWFQDQAVPTLEGASGEDLKTTYPAALRWEDDVNGPTRPHLQFFPSN